MITNTVISKYSSASSLLNMQVYLDEELRKISSGEYEKPILLCRKLYESGDKLSYTKNKASLPALTFSGLFSGSHRKQNLIKYSQFIILDVDAIEKNEIDNIKSTIFQDRYVIAVWISPSGCGLKVLIKVVNSDNEHKDCFDVLTYYYKVRYNINVDKSGCDVCRLCFVSFDDKLLIKQIAIQFDYTQHLDLEETLIKQKQASNGQSKHKEFIHKELVSEKIIFKKTENRNAYKNRESIVKILKFLKKNSLSITNNYNSWYRVAMAIANSFTYDLGEKYYIELCRLDGLLHDEYKSKYLLEYCYRNRKQDVIGFSTIIFLAKQKGFV